MMRIALRTLSLACLGAFAHVSALAAEPVVIVEVASGRQFTGAIDPASTAEELVLRSGSSNIVIRRPIRWERVVTASLDGQPVEPSELRRQAVEIAARAPAPVEASSHGASPSDRLPPPAIPPAVAERSAHERQDWPGSTPAAPPAPMPMPNVSAITFEARIANWDSDVETDGLLLDLLPLDGEGFLVPARGTIDVELFASQRRDFLAAPLAGGDTLERVERWTRALEPADFSSRGGRLKLPFGAVHPEFDQRWLAHYYGLVHVRFAVPGQGVFEDSQDGLRIRPYAPLRDRLELYSGRRFLPTERTGRGVSSAANEP